MKRLAIVLCALLIASVALGFDPTPGRGPRIGVLENRDRAPISSMVEQRLIHELQAIGVDAFASRSTIDDVMRDDASAEADYFVEVVNGWSQQAPVAEGEVFTGSSTSVVLSAVVGRLEAEVRLYDARTLELIDTYRLHASSSGFFPTGVGVGRRHFGAWISIPFIAQARTRSAASTVARDAAVKIAAGSRMQAENGRQP